MNDIIMNNDMLDTFWLGWERRYVCFVWTLHRDSMALCINSIRMIFSLVEMCRFSLRCSITKLSTFKEYVAVGCQYDSVSLLQYDADVKNFTFYQG